MSASFERVNFKSIGQPVRRKEDQRLICGEGRFSDDFNLPGQAYAAFVRSIYPHAHIRDIDLNGAQSMPGVLAGLTGKDCREAGLGTVPHSPLPSTRSDLKLTATNRGEVFSGPHALMPADTVRYVGEPVALVVAETRLQALDASEAVLVEYEPIPWVTDSQEAATPGAPVVWDEVPDNVCVDTTFGDEAATALAFD